MTVNSLPTITAIQRTNVVLVALSSLGLEAFRTTSSAIGCLFGGFVVIANLYILAALGRLALAAAGGGSPAARLGVLAIPLKLLLVVALVYLAFSRIRVDGLGFGIGVLTQMLAIIIETGRATIRSRA